MIGLVELFDVREEEAKITKDNGLGFCFEKQDVAIHINNQNRKRSTFEEEYDELSFDILNFRCLLNT